MCGSSSRVAASIKFGFTIAGGLIKQKADQEKLNARWY
jgi:hypothetical protein